MRIHAKAYSKSVRILVTGALSLSVAFAPIPKSQAANTATNLTQDFHNPSNWGNIAISKDGEKIFAIGSGATGLNTKLWISLDSGKTWSNTSTPDLGGGSINSISSNDDGTRVVLDTTFPFSSSTGGKGYIYTSSDSGSSWQRQDGAGVNFWGQLASSSSGSHLVASTWNSDLFVSDNFGVSWRDLTTFGSAPNYQVAVSGDGSKIFASNFQSYLSIASNFGASWFTTGVPVTGGVSSTAMSGDGSKIAVLSTEGKLWISKDAGQSWRSSEPPVINRGGQLWFSKDGSDLYATFNGKGIYVSGDFGNTWNTNNSQEAISKLVVSGDGKTMVEAPTDSSGYLELSSDYGKTWTPQKQISFGVWGRESISSDGSHIFVTGQAPSVTQLGKIYISSDSGKTFLFQDASAQTPGGQSTVQPSIQCVASSGDGSKLIASGGQFGPLGLFLSDDYGKTWSTLQNQDQTAGAALSVASGNDGNFLATANIGGIEISRDRGLSWNLVIPDKAQFSSWSSIALSGDGSRLIALESSTQYGNIWGKIWVSQDSGVTWKLSQSSSSQEWNSVASDSTGKNLVAIVTNGDIWTSPDSGVSWIDEKAAGQRAWTEVGLSADGSKIAASGGGGYIRRSDDFGKTWYDETSAGKHAWNSLSFTNDGSKLYALAFESGLWVIGTESGNLGRPSVNGGLISGVQLLSPPLPKSVRVVKLLQKKGSFQPLSVRANEPIEILISTEFKMRTLDIYVKTKNGKSKLATVKSNLSGVFKLPAIEFAASGTYVLLFNSLTGANQISLLVR